MQLAGAGDDQWAPTLEPVAGDQRIALLKNLAIMGGLLQVMAYGPGDLSLDGREKAR